MVVAVLVWLAVLGLGLLAPGQPQVALGPRVEVHLPAQLPAPTAPGGAAGQAEGKSTSVEAPRPAACPAPDPGWLEATIGVERARELGFTVPTYLPPGASGLLTLELRRRQEPSGVTREWLVIRSPGAFELWQEPAPPEAGDGSPLWRYCPGPEERQATVWAVQVSGRPAALLQGSGRAVLLWRSEGRWFTLQVTDPRIAPAEMVRMAESLR